MKLKPTSLFYRITKYGNLILGTKEPFPKRQMNQTLKKDISQFEYHKTIIPFRNIVILHSKWQNI